MHMPCDAMLAAALARRTQARQGPSAASQAADGEARACAAAGISGGYLELSLACAAQASGLLMLMPMPIWRACRHWRWLCGA